MNSSLMGTSYRFERKIPESYFHYRRLQEKRITMEREDARAHDPTLFDLQRQAYAADKVRTKIRQLDKRIRSSKVGGSEEQRKYAPFAWRANLLVRQAALRNLLKQEYMTYEEELHQLGSSFQKEWK